MVFQFLLRITIFFTFDNDNEEMILEKQAHLNVSKCVLYIKSFNSKQINEEGNRSVESENVSF